MEIMLYMDSFKNMFSISVFAMVTADWRSGFKPGQPGHNFYLRQRSVDYVPAHKKHHLRNRRYSFCQKVSFCKKQNLDLNFILFLIWRSSVI